MKNLIDWSWHPKAKLPSFFRVCLLVCLMLAAFRANAADQTFKALSREQMREELAHAYMLLREFHPNTYLYRSPAELEKIYKAIQRDIGPENSFVEAFALHARLLASICDMHTWPSTKDRKRIAAHLDKIWPMTSVQLDIRGDKLFARGLSKKDAWEVLTINGRSTRELIKTYTSMIARDGCALPKAIGLTQRTYVDLALMQILGSASSFYIEFIDPDTNEIKKAKVRGRAPSEVDAIYTKLDRVYSADIQSILKTEGFERQDRLLGSEPGDVAYYFSAKLDSAYFRIRDLPQFKKIKTILDAVMRDIIRKNPKHLIVDLTASAGGYADTASRLAAYLMPVGHRQMSRLRLRSVKRKLPESFHHETPQFFKSRERILKFAKFKRTPEGPYELAIDRRAFGLPDYKGQIYILISGLTASASSVVTSLLQRERNGVVIGWAGPSSARNYCTLNSGVFRMPHSKIDLFIPLQCRLNEDVSKDNLGRVKPDIEIDGFPMAYPLRDIQPLLRAIQEIQSLALTKED